MLAGEAWPPREWGDKEDSFKHKRPVSARGRVVLSYLGYQSIVSRKSIFKTLGKAMTNQSFSGTGEVLHEGEHVCNVTYRLLQRASPSKPIEITGEITIHQSDRSNEVANLFGSGQILTLRLEDNQELMVYFNPKDPIGGIWRVVQVPGNSPLVK